MSKPAASNMASPSLERVAALVVGGEAKTTNQASVIDSARKRSSLAEW